MMEVDWANFWNSFDFDAAVEVFTSGSWRLIFGDNFVRAAIALLVASIAYEKTRGSGIKAAMWIPVGLFYAVGGVILKNSTISEVGPFVLLAGMFMFAAGYFVATNFLQLR